MYKCPIHLICRNHPELYPTRQWLGWYMSASIAVNYILTMCYNSYYRPKKTQTSGLVDSNWRHCLDCNHLTPPRAHHCTICKGNIGQVPEFSLFCIRKSKFQKTAESSVRLACAEQIRMNLLLHINSNSVTLINFMC